MDMEQIRRNLYGFARQHNLHFQEKGECGFGRPCVGLGLDGHWVDYNPNQYPDFMPVAELCDERLRPGAEAPDAYHKHDCFTVLVHGEDYDEAIRQLHAWIDRLRSTAPLEVVEYNTGATGFQAMFSGITSNALTFKR